MTATNVHWTTTVTLSKKDLKTLHFEVDFNGDPDAPASGLSYDLHREHVEALMFAAGYHIEYIHSLDNLKRFAEDYEIMCRFGIVASQSGPLEYADIISVFTDHPPETRAHITQLIKTMPLKEAIQLAVNRPTLT